MARRELAELAAGSRVLVDANIFVYAANGTSPQCVEFLDRCARQAVRGISTFEVLSEVCHRLMLEEAVAAGSINKPLAARLRRSHSTVRQLKTYWPPVAGLLDSNLLLLALDQARFRRAQAMRELYGLLTNDSLIVAAAESYGITNLATRDADFDVVPWLTVYKPQDIP